MNFHKYLNKVTAVWHFLYALVPAHKLRLKEACMEWESLAFHLHSHHGPVVASDYLKSLYNEGVRLSVGYPCSQDSYPFWVKTFSDGFPKSLPCIHRLLKGRRIKKVIGLTILSVFYVMSVPPKIDVNSITKPCTGTNPDGGSVFRSWVKRGIDRSVGLFRFIPREGVPLPKPLFLTKSGPMGVPSILGSVQDARALVRTPVGENVFVYLLNLLFMLGADAEALAEQIKTLIKFSTFGSPILLKTSAISDSGGKTRLVTSPSYWIQYGLYPFHRYFMRFLRNIPEDYTYKQGVSKDMYRKWYREGRNLYSFDLSSATDRFPLQIQSVVLKEILGETIEEAWTYLMRLPTRIALSKKLYLYTRFKVGQPMGVYSSWPIFALTHHLVIHYCAWKVGSRARANYMILGDDVVIADDDIASSYYRFVTERLGVEVSAPKSMKCDLAHHRMEFAKQIFYNGREITPLRPDMISGMRERYFVLIKDVVSFLKNRWSLKISPKHLSLPRVIFFLPRNKRKKGRDLLLYPFSPLTEREKKSFTALEADYHKWSNPQGVTNLEEGMKQLLAIQRLDKLLDRLKVLLVSLQDQYQFGQPYNHTKVVDRLQNIDYSELDEFWKSLGSVSSHPLFRVLTRLMWKLRFIRDNGVTALSSSKETSYDEVLYLTTEVYYLEKILEGVNEPLKWGNKRFDAEMISHRRMNEYLTAFKVIRGLRERGVVLDWKSIQKMHQMRKMFKALPKFKSSK